MCHRLDHRSKFEEISGRVGANVANALILLFASPQIWKKNSEDTIRDEVIMFEVLTEQPDKELVGKLPGAIARTISARRDSTVGFEYHQNYEGAFRHDVNGTLLAPKSSYVT